MIDLSRLGDFERALVEFNERFRGRDVPELRVLGPFDLGPIVRREINWNETFGSDHPGVYCFFDAQGAVYYIGKATGATRGIGNRVWEHIEYNKQGENWVPKALVTVPANDDQPFVAAALEEFLILRLDPYGNTQGRPRPLQP